MRRIFAPKTMAAITRLLALSIMGAWLVSMVCLTLVTAQEFYDQLYSESVNLVDRVENSGNLNMFYDRSFGRYGLQYERPDMLEYLMLQAISRNTGISYFTGGPYNTTSNHSKLIRAINYPMDSAVLFYDGEGKLLHSSEDAFMFFNYYTQAEWDTGMDSTAGLHYGWIDISEGKDAEDWKDDPYSWLRSLYVNTHDLSIRVTGFFEGNELKPVIMHYVTDTQVWQVGENSDQFSTNGKGWEYLLSDVDRTGQLEWQLRFDRSEAYAGKDLVTVYITYPELWEDYEKKALDYDGESYESLAALTEELDLLSRAGTTCFRYGSNSGIRELNELLVFGGRTYADYEGFDYSSGGEPPTEFIMVTAIRSHPLSCAVSALRNIYIITGLMALILLLTVRKRIKAHFVQPVTKIADAMEDGWKDIYRPEHAPSMWPEAEKLHGGFEAEQDRRRMKDNEITRLNTALDYARTAEENRRQMTSNIAHELKTPLAVIHSYAEGLKEHIAEEKRDKYLDIILSETERMDQMVLEMLDLSRLEAGKVKLARDDVSLIALTRSVFEKLEMAAQAKALQIDYDCPEDFTVSADEGRIAQVIENFATNAIKYTPAGGHITVRIQKGRSGASFAIENESEALSAEALRKVWDSFYRTDESRSGGGTGLGLAIAKNIIELHGGKCAVRNTKLGVEFSFTI